MRKQLQLVTLLVFTGLNLAAGIIYDSKNNCIMVSDFPKDMPCVLPGLYKMDQISGWKKIAYDEKTDTYTISCNLQIGSNDGTETYFQVGSKEHPNEILVMKGVVYLAPYWVSGENPGVYYRVPVKVNRLTLGSEEDKNIKTALKFDPAETYNKLGINAGMKFGADGKVIGGGIGGELFAFNGEVTNAGGKRYCANILGKVKLINSTFSGAYRALLYGMHNVKNDSIIEGIILKNASEGAGINATLTMKNCVFENLSNAVNDPGAINATFINCIFRNNNINFIVNHTFKSVTLIDCEVSPGKNADIIEPWDIRGKKRIPAFFVKHHVIVEVKDADGKPVAGAKVKAVPEQNSPLVADCASVTGQDGQTPGKDAQKALLLTESLAQATEKGKPAATTNFTYVITATANNKTVEMKGVKPDRNWMKLVLTVK